MKRTILIIATIFGTTALCVAFLLYAEGRHVRDGENFYSVAFADPLGETNDVIIDNRTARDALLHYTATTGDDTVFAEDDVTVAARDKQTISIAHPAPLVVTVTVDDHTFSIEKK